MRSQCLGWRAAPLTPEATSAAVRRGSRPILAQIVGGSDALCCDEDRDITAYGACGLAVVDSGYYSSPLLPTVATVLRHTYDHCNDPGVIAWWQSAGAIVSGHFAGAITRWRDLPRKLGKDEQKEDEQSWCCARAFGFACISRS